MVTQNEVVYTSTIAHQCAWCTAVIDGIHKDELFFVQVDGVLQPDRLQTYSHVLCQRCYARQRGLWRRRQKQQDTMLPLRQYCLVSF